MDEDHFYHGFVMSFFRCYIIKNININKNHLIVRLNCRYIYLIINDHLHNTTTKIDKSIKYKIIIGY